ncbi:hypothetical protein BB560_006836 [Smittium megazygosporum]|uniref:Uncharacterized protein n=1 Tax=Smittium megazygosporum TaxID=133381 RepID=A0A2T9Y156_9FUNG|nr:hypothetical protein BB560_006836 [Smittium megazygosporum]
MGFISKTVYYEYNQGIPFDKVPTGFYKNSVAILGNDFINNYCHYGYTEESANLEDSLSELYSLDGSQVCEKGEISLFEQEEILWDNYYDVLGYPFFMRTKENNKIIVCAKEYLKAIKFSNYSRLMACLERNILHFSESSSKWTIQKLEMGKKKQRYLKKISEYEDNEGPCDKTIKFKQFLNYTSSKNSRIAVFSEKLASIQYGELDTKGCYKSFEKNMKIPNQNANNDLFVISKFLSDNELDGICIIWDYKEKTLEEDVSGIRKMINRLKSRIKSNQVVSVLIKAPEEKKKVLYKYFVNNIMKSQFKPNTVYFLDSRNTKYAENELKEIETLIIGSQEYYTQPLI